MHSVALLCTFCQLSTWYLHSTHVRLRMSVMSFRCHCMRAYVREHCVCLCVFVCARVLCITVPTNRSVSVAFFLLLLMICFPTGATDVLDPSYTWTNWCQDASYNNEHRVHGISAQQACCQCKTEMNLRYEYNCPSGYVKHQDAKGVYCQGETTLSYG
jgi:hypothetical protein